MYNEHIPPETTEDQGIEALVRKSGSSFYWAMRVLPRRKRMAMYAIYAFCRIVDDIADGSDCEADKLSQLTSWREELDHLYRGDPGTVVSIALATPIQEYGLPKRDFLAVIEGMERDANPCVRIADEQDLTTYCDAVACSVGRLANRIFGVGQETGNSIAESLGQALQLTNILRDVAEDAVRDRVYIPETLLARHGVSGDDPGTLLSQPGFPAACQELADMAVSRYEATERLLRAHDRTIMRPAMLMMQTYWTVLRRLQKRGWDDNSQRIKLSALEKFLIMLRYGFLPL